MATTFKTLLGTWASLAMVMVNVTSDNSTVALVMRLE